MYFRVMLSVLSVLLYAGIVHAAPFAYIANNADNTVSVLDTASNKVTAVLNVGQGPSGVAVNRMGSRVYVSNQTDNTISVIDTLDNSTSSIGVSLQPGALAVNAAGTRLFVANPSADSISIINTITKSLVSTVPLAANCQPEGIVVGPADVSGNYSAYISCYGTAAMAVINANDTGSYVKSATEVPVPSGPRGITVSADGKKVFVASFNASKLTVINAQDLLAVPVSISVGLMPWGVAVDPTVTNSVNSTKLYVANSAGDSVSVVDAAGAGIGTLAVSATKAVGTMPIGIAFTGDGVKAVTVNNNYASLGTSSVVLNSDNSVTTTDGDSGVGTTPPNMKIGTNPMSFGNFAGPDFVTINAGVNNSNCGEISTSELITTTPVTINDKAYNAYQVAKGKNIAFNVTAYTNCAITTVDLNGVSQGAITGYTFTPATAAANLYATFTRTAYIFALQLEGTGSGNAVSKVYNPSTYTYVLDGGIDCGGVGHTKCSASYPAGTQIRVSVTPDSSSTLNGWLGACVGSGGSCDLVFNDATAILKGGESGTFSSTVSFRQSGGPVRTDRAGTPKTYQLFENAFDAIASSSTVNPLDLDTSKEYAFNATGVLGTVSKPIAITLVGGWTNYSTAPYGDLPAGSASIIRHVDSQSNPLPTVIAYGSLTIGSYNMGDGVNHGAIIIK
jgi:YVTN family beta-propeller protein